MKLSFDKEASRMIELLAVSRNIPLEIDTIPALNLLSELVIELVREKLGELRQPKPASEAKP